MCYHLSYCEHLPWATSYSTHQNFRSGRNISFSRFLARLFAYLFWLLFPRFWLFPRLRITWDFVVNGRAKKNCPQQLKISSLSPITAAFISDLKSKTPGRQIASVWSWPTERISSYLNKIMGPIVNLPSLTLNADYIFLNFNFPGENKITFTMDTFTVKEPNSGTLFLLLTELIQLVLTSKLTASLWAQN